MITFIILWFQEHRTNKQNQPKHGKNSSEKVPVVVLVEKFSVEVFHQKMQFKSFEVISEEHTSFTQVFLGRNQHFSLLLFYLKQFI